MSRDDEQIRKLAGERIALACVRTMPSGRTYITGGRSPRTWSSITGVRLAAALQIAPVDVGLKRLVWTDGRLGELTRLRELRVGRAGPAEIGLLAAAVRRPKECEGASG